MARRPIMDPTKEPLGVLTMAYRDHDLLQTWVDYYGAQVGRQHLYVLSHGGDPKHREIADGCNVIYLPRDETMQKWDRLRWFLMTNFTNGFLRYYNWMICGDVDELVVVDPEVAPGLVDYIKRYDTPRAPKSLSPFGIEIVHNPELEPKALSDPGPLLSKRSLFRINVNYAKPCVVRTDVNFTVGGHANNHQPRFLDPHLYLLHLRFYDYEKSCERLIGRAEMRKVMQSEAEVQKKQPWSNAIEGFRNLALQEPKDTTLDFPDFRRRMVEKAKDLHNGKVTFFGGGRGKDLYRLPERFREVI